MKFRKSVLVLTAAFCFSPVTYAANAWRVGPITQVQMDSHVRPGYQDVVWIFMAGSWSGVNCGADWAWFNAKEDAHLLAQVLTARATNSQLRVYVDDSL